MWKRSIGKIIYYTTIIVGFILIFYGPKLILKISEEPSEAEKILFERQGNLIYFLTFAVLMPIGLFAREFLTLEYVMHKMIIKIIVAITVLIIGLTLWYLIPNVLTSKLIMYGSMISLVFMLIPSKINENKKV